MPSRSTSLVLSAIAATALVVPAAAGAQDLPVSIPGATTPDPGQVVAAPPASTPAPAPVNDVVDQLPAQPPDDGTGAVTGAVGAVGGVVSGVAPGVIDTLNGALGGAGLPTLPSPFTNVGGVLVPNPNSPLAGLLGTLGQRSGNSANGGVGTVTGQGIVPGTNVIDARSPKIVVTVTSKLRTIAKTGKMALRVTSDEPAIAAIGGTVTPGKPTKKKFKTKHFSKAVKVPAAVLAFKKAGALKVTVQLARDAQRRLGRSKSAKLSVTTVASDIVGNQAAKRIAATVKR